MLHILLTILKIIGIIVLAILGLLILLLCIVFFVPLRYELIAESKGDLKNTKLNLTFHWLLHLFSGYVIYNEEKLDYRIRVLWKKISGDDLNKNNESTEDSEEESKEEVEDVVDKILEKADPEKKVDDVLDKADPEKIVDSILEPEKEASDEKTSENKLDKLKCTIRKVCDTIKMVLEFLKGEAHIGALGRIKSEVIRLLVSLKPNNLKGNVRFGMEDPYQTGQILAGLSVLYPIYGDNVEIYPEFDKKILEGDVYLKGHIRGVHAVKMVFNIIIDKNVRTTIKDVKALFESN